MAIIQKTLDPRTNQEIVFAKGKIKSIRLQKFDEPKVTHFNGKAIISTHQGSLLLTDNDGDVWVNLGNLNLKRDTIGIKTGENKWTNLAIGMIISADLKVATTEKGTFYNSKPSLIHILDASTATTNNTAANNSNNTSQAQTNGKQGSKVYGVIASLELPFADVKDDKNTITKVNVSTTSDCEQLEVGMRVTAIVDKFGNILSGYKSYPNATNSKKTNKRDNSGIEVGHATNVTFKLLKLSVDDINNTNNQIKIKNHIKKVLIESHKFREEQRGNYSDIDDYMFGAKAGQAILLAADLADDLPKTLKLAGVLMPLINDVETGWKSYLDKQKQEQQTVVETASNKSPASNKTDQQMTETVAVENEDSDTPPPFTDDEPNWGEQEEFNNTQIDEMPEVDFDDDVPF